VPLKSGEAFDLLPAWTIRVTVKRPDGTSVVDTATVNIEDGTIEYTLGNSFNSQSGAHQFLQESSK